MEGSSYGASIKGKEGSAVEGIVKVGLIHLHAQRVSAFISPKLKMTTLQPFDRELLGYS